MVNSVKSCRKIKKNKSRDFLLIDSSQEVTMDFKKTGLDRMVFPVGRLEYGKRREHAEVRLQADIYDFFKNFWKENLDLKWDGSWKSHLLVGWIEDDLDRIRWEASIKG